jgi:hypothetical protein
MLPYLWSRFRHPAHALTGALCLVLLACSGGKDATGPNPGPPDSPEPPRDNPEPPPPAPSITGAYVLVRINDSEPSQMVTLANPGGEVIGLYRFHENSVLGLTDDLTWTLSLKFEDERDSHQIEDEGRFSREGEELQFESTTFGDAFVGTARPEAGVVGIQYDVDGDGQPDTVFVFTRILGPGS